MLREQSKIQLFMFRQLFSGGAQEVQADELQHRHPQRQQRRRHRRKTLLAAFAADGTPRGVLQSRNEWYLSDHNFILNSCSGRNKVRRSRTIHESSPAASTYRLSAAAGEVADVRRLSGSVSMSSLFVNRVSGVSFIFVMRIGGTN